MPPTRAWVARASDASLARRIEDIMTWRPVSRSWLPASVLTAVPLAAVVVPVTAGAFGATARHGQTPAAGGTCDVSGVFRLKIGLNTSATPAATAAVATPEVLCTR